MAESAPWMALRGQRTPPPERIALRAGPFSLVLEQGDIRYVRYGEAEVLRRVYLAVRDRNWRTPPLSVSNLEVTSEERSFRASYLGRFQHQDIDFQAQVTIEGDDDGTLRFAFEGEALSIFQRNRLGICVLHPIETCAGRPFQARKTDGSSEFGTLPREISPHQPVQGLGTLTHEIVPGLTASMRFEGDVFEMEDQRNWTDASFKTYSTPLSRPFPVTVQAGERVSQAVTLSLVVTGLLVSPGRWPPPLTFTVGQATTPLPEIGLSLTSGGGALTVSECDRLQALHLAHLRVNVDPGDLQFSARLRQAVAESEALRVPLEVALFLAPDTPGELDTLDRLLRMLRPRVRRWLVYDRTARSTTDEGLLRQARLCLRQHAPGVPLVSGTDSYFTFLNRERPPIDLVDGVSFAITPQVHAFDETSLRETLPAQGWTVESARAFSGRLPIVVSPVTLRPRQNADANVPEPDPLPGEPASTVDPRQMSLLGAGWTVGSVAALAASRAASITYYETLGWKGVLERAEGSPDPERFPSVPGGAFPLYHVLADVGEVAGGQVVEGRSSDPLTVTGLVLRRGSQLRILLANLTSERHRLALLGPEGGWRSRALDERTIDRAVRRPESFRSGPTIPYLARGGRLELELLPYAVLCLDQS